MYFENFACFETPETPETPKGILTKAGVINEFWKAITCAHECSAETDVFLVKLINNKGK